jgi:hypothetical protein
MYTGILSQEKVFWGSWGGEVKPSPLSSTTDKKE